MIKTALRWSACLFALASLASCGLLPPKPQILSRPQLIEVPSPPAYVPAPAALTDPLPPHPAPASNCKMADGSPAVCLLDALGMIPLYQADIEVCNSDRAKTALLGTTDGQK